MAWLGRHGSGLGPPLFEPEDEDAAFVQCDQREHFKRGRDRIRARQESREHGEPDDRIAAMTPQRCGAEEARTTEASRSTGISKVSPRPSIVISSKR